MKYKVGDKVRIRRDLSVNCDCYPCVIKEMANKAGDVVTIDAVNIGTIDGDYYEIVDNEWYWTDEMFDGLAEDELTVEEAIKIQAEMCSSMSSCKNCPIRKEKGGYGCESFKAENPEKVVEIIKQWKKDHEKKEIETEIVDLIKVMKEVYDDEKCIYTYEIDTNEEDVDEKMNELVKQYYEENGSKIYAKCKRICRVKS